MIEVSGFCDKDGGPAFVLVTRMDGCFERDGSSLIISRRLARSLVARMCVFDGVNLFFDDCTVQYCVLHSPPTNLSEFKPMTQREGAWASNR